MYAHIGEQAYPIQFSRKLVQLIPAGYGQLVSEEWAEKKHEYARCNSDQADLDCCANLHDST